MKEYTGKTAVITGGGRGFGKAFGAALAQQGAVVALVDRDADAVRDAADEIGALAIAFAGDITDEARIDAIMAEVALAHGGIDILINNAGLHSQEYSRPLAEMGVAKTRRLFEVNVIGTVVCTLPPSPSCPGGRARAS